MFQVKICGVTNSDDAEKACAAGADAIGLNFYEGSQRFVDIETAKQIALTIPRGVIRVGVFVNASAIDVCRTFDTVGLEAIQLHGDEPPPFLSLLGKRPVIRAFRCRDSGVDEVQDYLAKCVDLQCMPHSVLTDAYYPGQYGGTGRVFDWKLLNTMRATLDGVRLVLAGGLTPENVADAIVASRPHAVDTASGVEAEAGIKDPDRLLRFVSNARAAFASFDN